MNPLELNKIKNCKCDCHTQIDRIDGSNYESCVKCEKIHNLKLNVIHNIDCLEFMKTLPDKSIDWVITDPPYGKMWTRGKNGIGMLKDKNENDKTLWDIKPKKEVFDEILRVGKQVIIFGGNYFTDYLPPSNCWIVWDKLGDLKLGEQIPFAHCELAWTSLNKTVKKYTFRSQGFIKDTKDIRVHPTQKPTELFAEIIKDFSKENDIILDPFLGSGTTAVACKMLKRNYIGCEISPEYCKIAEDRINSISNTLF